MAHEAIDSAIALRLQLATICGGEPDTSWIEVRPLYPGGGADLDHREFVLVAAAPDRLPELVAELAPRVNVFIGAAPRVREEGTAAAVERVWCLWADLDGEASLERLYDFRPLPSIVIRTGSPGCAHAYWPLRESIPAEWARLANRRLARRLGGDLHATDAARVLRPAGSLNHKHNPPAPALCTRLELDVRTLAEVVRGLPDDPAPTSRTARPRSARGEHGAVLEGLLRTVEQAQVGNRNNSLHWAACRAVERIAGGELDAGETYERLRDAALAAGLPEAEVDATLRSASRCAGAPA